MTVNLVLALILILVGAGAFLFYQLRLRQEPAADIVLRIVAVVRRDVPDKLSKVDGLNAGRLAECIEFDKRIRNALDPAELPLLKQALRRHLLKTVAAYALCGLLFLTGAGWLVFALRQPRPMILSDFALQSNDEEAQGWAVDLDDLMLSWKTEGSPENLKIALENSATGQRTPEQTVSAAQENVIFPKTAYAEILSVHQKDGMNHVRAAIQTSNGTIKSQEFELHVGIKILASYYANRNMLEVTALIGDRAVPYSFKGTPGVWTKETPSHLNSYADDVTTPARYKAEHAERYDWETLKVEYFGPDNSRVVRTESHVESVTK